MQRQKNKDVHKYTIMKKMLLKAGKVLLIFNICFSLSSTSDGLCHPKGLTH